MQLWLLPSPPGAGENDKACRGDDRIGRENKGMRMTIKEIMKAIRFSARLEDVLVYNDRFAKYEFELTEPHRLEFLAGQYLTIQVSDKGEMRAYSICSPPAIDHGFELLIDHQPNGVGVNFFKRLGLNPAQPQIIKGLGPMGRFTLVNRLGQAEVDEQALVLVATGCGVAPMMSVLLDQLQTKGDQRPITLYWGMRKAEDLFWLEDFNLLVDTYANFHFYPILSQPTPEWTLSRGHVDDLLVAHDFIPQTGFYLCGGRSMIVENKQLLTDRGILPQFIHHEHFF